MGWMFRGSNPGGGKFCATVQTGPGAQTASYTMGKGGIPEAKRPGGGANHSPQSSAKVKERVELYLYSPPSGPSWPVLWCIRTLPLFKYGDGGVYFSFITVKWLQPGM